MNAQVKYFSDKILLRRERSLFVPVALISTGTICLLFCVFVLNILDGDYISEFPFSIQKFSVAGIGITLITLGLALPRFLVRNSPYEIIFDKTSAIVSFKSSATAAPLSIPFSNISAFEIEQEKRSPSTSNSTGVHFVHYHIVLIWKSSGKWFLTETTVPEEADKLIAKLNECIAQPGKAEPKIQLPESVRHATTAGVHTASWNNNRSAVMAVLFFFSNSVLAIFFWWLLTESSDWPIPIFIFLGIIFFALLAVARIVGPALYEEATTSHHLKISQGMLTYTEASRFTGKPEMEKQIHLKDVSQIEYTFSPLNMKMNRSLSVRGEKKENKFAIHTPNLHPVECLALEYWIKTTLMINQ